jgi:maltooligosyltrehalose trehalohydrolase
MKNYTTLPYAAAKPGQGGRRLPVGAELVPGGASFRVWAPGRKTVRVAVESGGEHTLTHTLTPEANGYFSVTVPDLGAGARYGIRLDDDAHVYPDPASRYQPDGPHGLSQIADPVAFAWSDGGWRGVTLRGQVLYEMHVGTFTPEGTWRSAIAHLPKLKHVGVTVIEMMPIAEFPGRFGWGYDGVDLFAPTRLYGEPDDLRRFVDAAHGIGLGVILDVVYNHFGPDGCYLKQFTPSYFTDRYSNEWGEAINFDGDHAAGVRDFIVANAFYWIDEFHFDGLRLDATQSIFDSSERHILAEIGDAARRAAAGRDVIVVAENEPQETRIVRPRERGGFGLDALWNDDLHHSAMVALTGRNPAYYHDHKGRPQEFISAAKYGYLYQGQYYAWQSQSRGTPALDLAPAHFVQFVQNHDQVANSPHGERFHEVTTPGRARAMTALMALLPGTPMLFQGQEFWSSSRFLYFADHNPELAQLVTKGRREFLSQFPGIAELGDRLADPSDPRSFERSRLDWSEWEEHGEIVAMHRDLFAMRRDDPAFARQARGAVDGAVLADECFLLRFFGEDGDDRLLLVNFGLEFRADAVPEPLLAPPAGKAWRRIWSSEDPKYGGCGTPDFFTPKGYHVIGHSAQVLAPA